VHRVLCRARDDIDPEAARDLGEVVAVLRLLRLREDHEPASGADEVIDRRDLGVRVHRRPLAGRRLPLIGGAVRQDQDVDALQGRCVQRARDMRLHIETRTAEHCGSLRVGGICGIGRAHGGGELRPGGPGLAMALVDEHAHEGTHGDSLLRGCVVEGLWQRNRDDADPLAYLMPEDLPHKGDFTGRSPASHCGWTRNLGASGRKRRAANVSSRSSPPLRRECALPP